VPRPRRAFVFAAKAGLNSSSQTTGEIFQAGARKQIDPHPPTIFYSERFFLQSFICHPNNSYKSQHINHIQLNNPGNPKTCQIAEQPLISQ
jgi:hypothetical protein